MTMAPLIARDQVIVGISGGEYGVTAQRQHPLVGILGGFLQRW